MSTGRKHKECSWAKFFFLILFFKPLKTGQICPEDDLKTLV